MSTDAIKTIRVAPYVVACSMQHALTVLTYQRSCKTCFHSIPVFGGKVSLIILTIDLCQQLSWMTQLHTFGASFPVSWSVGQLALKFHWVKTCFFLACIDSVDITNYIEIAQSIMPKPVYLLNVQEAHKEYNFLMDQIWAKYEQIDSGGFGAVGTPAFNAKVCELANLLACMSQLCQKLNLPSPKELYRLMFFKH